MLRFVNSVILCYFVQMILAQSKYSSATQVIVSIPVSLLLIKSYFHDIGPNPSMQFHNQIENTVTSSRFLFFISSTQQLIEQNSNNFQTVIGYDWNDKNCKSKQCNNKFHWLVQHVDVKNTDEYIISLKLFDTPLYQNWH